MSDFKLVSIVDSQLEDINSEITLPIITGAQSSTYATFNSQQSSGNSQINFNIAVPSLSTAVSRHFLVQSTISLKISFVGTTTAHQWIGGSTLFDYGNSNALQAFPLNALLSTLQSNINNCNLSVNTREIMAGLMKMYNYEELSKYNSMTPALVDSFYQDFQDGLQSNNNVLSNYSTGGFAKEYQPRGTFVATAVGYITVNGIQTIQQPDALFVQANGDGTSPVEYIILTFTTTEPLLFLSPYISGLSNNQASFLGINSLTITMNLGDCSRIMSNASYAMTGTAITAPSSSVKTIDTVTLVETTANKLLLNFFTLPPNLFARIEPKNTVNFNQYSSWNYTSSTPIAPGASTTIQMNNIQLNQIPNKILIYCRNSALTTYDSNWFFVITSINLSMANRSGLLSSATPIQLYEMSVSNGLQMSYYEFSGSGMSNTGGTSTTSGTPGPVSTIGSILVIDPALNLSLDPQYTNCSSGQFNVQFTVTIQNQCKIGTASIIPTLYLVVCNGGLFTTETGTSSVYTSLITQEMCLDTKDKTPVMDSHTYHEEVVGGNIENLGSIHKHMKLNYHKASEKEKDMDSNEGNIAPKLGSGMAGSSMVHTNRPQRRIHKYI
jgi:hypothetical protein